MGKKEVKNPRAKGLDRLFLRAEAAEGHLDAVRETLEKWGAEILPSESISSAIERLKEEGFEPARANRAPIELAEGDAVILTDEAQEEVMEVFGYDTAPRGCKVVTVRRASEAKNAPRQVVVRDEDGNQFPVRYAGVRRVRE